MSTLLRVVAAATLLCSACAAADDPDILGAGDDATAGEARAYGSSALRVFVMDNDATKNTILAYRRAYDGRLLPGARFPTGGVGSGGGLGSQGAVVLDASGTRLLAVNAGSNELSLFEVRGDVLVLRDLVASGGARPVSVTVHDDLVYVLNAGAAATGASAEVPANITGFRLGDDDTLMALGGSTRGLSRETPSVAAAQVQFSSDGSTLVVPERATNNLTTFVVGSDGSPGPALVTPSHGMTPFGLAFAPSGVLVVSEAFGGAPGLSAVSTYTLEDGLPVLVSGSVPTGQTAACWIAITKGGSYAYTTNTASDTVSGYRLMNDGKLTLLGAGVATTAAGDGPIDMAFGEGAVLYVLNGAGDSISVLRARSGGGLQTLPGVSGLPASAVGIAAR